MKHSGYARISSKAMNSKQYFLFSLKNIMGLV